MKMNTTINFPEPIFNDLKFDRFNSKEPYTFQDLVNRKEMLEVAIKREQFAIDLMYETKQSIYLPLTYEESLESCKQTLKTLNEALATI